MGGTNRKQFRAKTAELQSDKGTTLSAPKHGIFVAKGSGNRKEKSRKGNGAREKKRKTLLKMSPQPEKIALNEKG